MANKENPFGFKLVQSDVANAVSRWREITTGETTSEIAIGDLVSLNASGLDLAESGSTDYFMVVSQIKNNDGQVLENLPSGESGTIGGHFTIPSNVFEIQSDSATFDQSDLNSDVDIVVQSKNPISGRSRFQITRAGADFRPTSRSLKSNNDFEQGFLTIRGTFPVAKTFWK